MSDEIERSTDDLIESLRLLEEMSEANARRNEEIRRRAGALIARLETGEDLPAVVEGEPQPLIINLLSENIDALHNVGSTMRKAEAIALRAHGYTMERIAELFGVTRQRISALLAESDRDVDRGYRPGR